ncbi:MULTISPECIES: methyltransferase domain-containing protein [unclassified Nodularia (in: cyanobacteria)]|uniref:class I SAM-dependent methyltransferase n=1 Tax=unclassified Nodularia (in: cyanobacteria) TaxID=2656917 RepID=UPI00187F6FAE|nr:MULTISPECIES: methyltransferase domain-containing protein [unclassified Nodularia (in: cyanobacteria)]MBE9199424.1 methyltransferase domain-containing protein [Nodularia sp. LEGE 06071]MCC2692922.1 methyltransferase domain-containing protein [Nodularia sp. LEGE 04288]
MISGIIKGFYYLLLKYPMRFSGWFYKKFICPKSELKVHLGPGKSNYLNGWLNVDANLITAKVDVWSNLLDPLPFRKESVDIFYSHHVVEHLPDSHLIVHFQEMFQALRPGGGIRIGAPNMGNACRKYLQGDYDWFSNFPENRKSLGGRFTNMIFCRGEHLTALDESYLGEIAEKCGFVDISFPLPVKETNLKDLGISEVVLSKEYESDFAFPHTVILEARKPE